jgi:HK97 family phage major capsid protein
MPVNLDVLNAQRTAIYGRMIKAVQADDAEGFSAAFNDFAQALSDTVMEEARALTDERDAAVLASRGVRVLTSTERKFYEGIIGAMKSETPKQSLSNVDKVLPSTVIDAIFDNITEAHPLLSYINFTQTGALAKILVSTTSGVAAWGAIGAEISSELSASFAEIDLVSAQLTAYIPVNKYMLELGPQWLDSYVRTLLGEALAAKLEAGIVDGTGKDQPIGMSRALSGAVDGEYPRKTDLLSATALDAATYGTIVDALSQGPNGLRRPVSSVVMIVNPADYFAKIFPASTVRTTDGGFTQSVFPFPTTVIQSPAVPSGKAIFGLADRYFMGLGTGDGGKIEYSDEVQFLARNRVYLIYLYGYGRPLDAHAFEVVDISRLVPYVQSVKVTNSPLETKVTNSPLETEAVGSTKLTALSVGALTLSPTFDRDKTAYTATTTAATNTISATAKDGDATIAIKNGNTAVANGAAATWAAGENVVTVTVTNGDESTVYTVTVTKSE